MYDHNDVGDMHALSCMQVQRSITDMSCGGDGDGGETESAQHHETPALLPRLSTHGQVLIARYWEGRHMMGMEDSSSCFLGPSSAVWTRSYACSILSHTATWNSKLLLHAGTQANCVCVCVCVCVVAKASMRQQHQ